jgi:predicted nucleotidyltransferase
LKHAIVFWFVELTGYNKILGILSNSKFAVYLMIIKLQNMNRIVKEKLNDIIRLCENNGVKSLYIFGSANTDKFDNKSDIDFLIAFKESLSIEEYTENYFTLQYKLRELFNREIDLVTQNSLSNPYFIQSIDQNKQLLYGA